MALEKNNRSYELKGISASPGITIGKAFLVNREKVKIPQRKINYEDVVYEVEKFYKCLNEIIENIVNLKNKIDSENFREEVLLLDMQLLLLNDSHVSKETVEIIKDKKINSEWALNIVLDKIFKKFDEMSDQYIAERKNDIKQIFSKVMNCLMGKKFSNLEDIKKPVILIGHDFSPAETIQMNFSKIKGFITEVGSKTSHTAIIARSQEIPAVVGLKNITDIINGGDDIILDGFTGTIYVNPEESLINKYKKQKLNYLNFIKQLNDKKERVAVTKDGKQIDIFGNIEMPQEIEAVVDHGGEGVGLFRTEYLYLSKDNLPSEEEHFNVYNSVAEKLYPKPLVIRTLDIGGDKFLENYNKDDQLNPAMGLRAIRFCFKEIEIFKTQLKGILRASKNFDNIKILIPMVSGIKEINETKKIISECIEELDMTLSPPLGIMIEIPSAAIISDIFAKKVDFLSIGTNDLIQYTLAIDRLNHDVTYLYEPAHPAVLRLISTTINSAKKNNIRVNMCGEMAGEILYIPLLVGMGIDALSMNPVAIPFVKEIICNITLAESKKILDEIMKMDDCKTIESYLRETMHKKFKDFSFIF